MGYIVGAGLLFGAVLTIALGRILLRGDESRQDTEAFGAAEAIAFLFTLLFTVGVSLMAARTMEDVTPASLAQLAVALAMAGAASVAAWVAIGRLSRRAEAARDALPAGSPDAPRRGRPDRPSSTGVAPGRQGKRKGAA